MSDSESTPSDKSTSSLGQDELRSALKSVLKIFVREGQKKLGTALDDGRTSLTIRALKRDKQKMFEKLGREVVRLVEAGEIDHPGILRGVNRIKKIEVELLNHAELATEKNIDEPDIIE